MASSRPARATQQDHFQQPEQNCRLSRGFCLSPGSIRLPKAAKTPLKIHPLVRLPLATIVKDLGMGWEPYWIHLLVGGRWCQLPVIFLSKSLFFPLSFPFLLRRNYVYAFLFFFFGSSAVDQNPEPHVFWASGLLLGPITGTVTTFLNYFVI